MWMVFFWVRKGLESTHHYIFHRNSGIGILNLGNGLDWGPGLSAIAGKSTIVRTELSRITKNLGKTEIWPPGS